VYGEKLKVFWLTRPVDVSLGFSAPGIGWPVTGSSVLGSYGFRLLRLVSRYVVLYWSLTSTKRKFSTAVSTPLAFRLLMNSSSLAPVA
jgi:hypothetical protein